VRGTFESAASLPSDWRTHATTAGTLALFTTAAARVITSEYARDCQAVDAAGSTGPGPRSREAGGRTRRPCIQFSIDRGRRY
jgi:hypothetical protein